MAYIDPSHRNFSHLKGSGTLKLIHEVDAIRECAFVTSLLYKSEKYSLSLSLSLVCNFASIQKLAFVYSYSRSRAPPLPLLSRCLSLALSLSLSLSLSHTHTVAGKRVSNHALSAERHLAATLAQEVQQQLKGKN